nr:alpha/beta hydrolase [Actinokineospora globicatena]
MRPIVLVHGGWGGAWCWQAVTPLLGTARVFAPTLAGLGERADEPPAGITMRTHVEDVVHVLDHHDLHDVVLVGHSYGGIPITGAAHHRPGRVSDLVYLDALVPQDGQSCADVLGRGFVLAAESAMAEAGTPDRIPWLFTPEDLLGPDSPHADEVAARMTPHPTGTLFDPVATAGVTARRHYVFCTGSTGLGLTEGFAANARKRAEWRYSEIDGPHDAPHACPAAVAAALVAISSL